MFEAINAGTLLKVCLICIFVLIDASFILVILKGIGNIGAYFGLFLFTVLIFATLFFEKVISALFSDNSAMRICSRIVVCAFAAGLLLAVIISISMMIFACLSPDKPNTTVVVLGCKVNGSTPSLMLSDRINTAYGYLVENPQAKCIACGGKGDDEDVTEAYAIKKALVDMGIDEGRIYLDETSVDTFENLRNAKIIAEQNSLGDGIAIATDGFHQMRSQLLASDCGFKPSALSVRTRAYLLPTYWVREWFAICEYFVFIK